MNPVEIIRGDSPVVLGMPHTGTWVPEDIFNVLNGTGQALADTDWHIHTLYDGLLASATKVRAQFHRYVIDANRDPSGASLYPGQNTTDFCPVTDFDGLPIYLDGKEPSKEEKSRRINEFHTPYHQALSQELKRVHDKHGVVILYDCHSIRSHIPFLFEGILPDFNIGTNEGTTCAAEVETIVANICMDATDYVTAVNGRFKGGWTTRHYGKPELGFHAIQMELTQKTHLESETAPFAYSEAKADSFRVHLQAILQGLEDWALIRSRIS